MDYDENWNELAQEIYESPNYTKGEDAKSKKGIDRTITHIIIHITGVPPGGVANFEGPKARFMNSNSRSRASAHYVIRKNGTIAQFVKDKDVAWHAGIFSNQRDKYDKNNLNWLSELATRPDAWKERYPDRNQPINYENHKYPNYYSIGIETIGGEFIKPEHYSIDRIPIINSLIILVRDLVCKYDIPIDREHILGHEDVNPLARWHWDPGPCFDWDDFISRIKKPLKTAYPYQSPASAVKEPNPLHWFDNPEQKNKGGYFPIGRNGTAHAGMHLFAPSGSSQAVSAMADGYVAAFRFYTPEQRRGQEENRSEDLRNLANPTHSGFVLLKHDFSTQEEDAPIQSFYSLYMDLQPPPGNGSVPWVDRLWELSKGGSISINHDDLGDVGREGSAGVYSRSAMDVLANLDFNGPIPVHKSNEHGVITFSEPWLTVTSEDTIGYTSSLSGESNYCHWEVFATENDVLCGLADLLGEQRDGGEFSFEDVEEAEDGIFSSGELNTLLDPEENRYKSAYFGLGAPYFKGEYEERTLAKQLQTHYSEKNDMAYNISVKLEESPAYTLKSDLSFQFQTVMPDGVIMESAPVVKELSELRSGTDWEVSSRAHMLRITPPEEIKEFKACSGSSFPLFLESARQEGLLRNSLLSMPSPWSESSLKKMINALKSYHYINPLYSFILADLAVINLFTDKQEEAVFDPVFGSGAFIDPAQLIHAVHPALFLWLLRLVQDALRNRNDAMIDCENPLKEYGFSVPVDNFRFFLGNKVKLIVLAEFNRPGIPDNRDDDGNRILNVAQNKGVSVTLNQHGVFTHELILDSWGRYEISGLRPIPTLEGSFTVPEPSWSSSELTGENRLRIHGIRNSLSQPPFICRIVGNIGSAPVHFLHFLLIGTNVDTRGLMDCEVAPANSEGFMEILIDGIVQAHGNNSFPSDPSWGDILTVTPRLYNGGMGFVAGTNGEGLEPEHYKKGYYLTAEDMQGAPDDYIEKGSLSLPDRKIEQSSKVTKNNNNSYVWLRFQAGGENRLDHTGNVRVNNETEVTLFTDPFTGERIKKSWHYDNSTRPVDFYLVRTAEGRLGWIYCSRVE